MVCIGLIPFGKHLLNFVEIKHISHITRFLLIVFLDLIYRLLNLPTHRLIVVSSCLLCAVTEDHLCKKIITRSSWLNCALRDDEAVYWVSIGHYEAVAVGN